MSQSGDLAEVQIRRRNEIDDQTNEAHRASSDSEPKPAGPKVKVDEAHDRDGEEKYGNLHPLLRPADLLGRRRVHYREFPTGDSRHGERGEGEEEILPGRTLDPYQQMRQRHRR